MLYTKWQNISSVVKIVVSLFIYPAEDGVTSVTPRRKLRFSF